MSLNLIYETLWAGVRSDLLISVQGKLRVFFVRSNSNGSIDVKMGGSVLEAK